MIELPRACFIADRIAKRADFFSFGTNDLTQTALGFSRDDVERRDARALHRGEDRRAQPVRDDRRARSRLARATRRLGGPRGKARPEARHLRRARRRPRLDRASSSWPASTTSAARPTACRSRAWPPPSAPSRRRRQPLIVPAEAPDESGGHAFAARPDLLRGAGGAARGASRCPRSPPAPTRPGAAVAEPDSDHRTPFQRDRDRIVHSKAFRRLKRKTQVFIAPEGDHYRTRLTHTLEASGIARNVARALSLNEDLTEAIALGHDLGHPPFGHIGEEVLDACVRERWGSGFRHNEHSLRVVERIEALNLTEPVRDGIRHHTGPGAPATLEGRIVQGRRPHRLHQPRHRRRAAGGDPQLRGPAARRDRAAWLDGLGAHRDAGGRPARPLRGRGRHRPGGGGGRRDAAPALVHVRARLPRRRTRSASGRGSSGC